MLSSQECINHLGRQFTATSRVLRPKFDLSMYPLEQMGCFLHSIVRHSGHSSHRDETIPDFRQRVELPHEARVEVHRRVQPTVSVHSLDLGAVLGVLKQIKFRYFRIVALFPPFIGESKLFVATVCERRASSSYSAILHTSRVHPVVRHDMSSPALTLRPFLLHSSKGHFQDENSLSRFPHYTSCTCSMYVTYENALNGIPEVLLCEGHHGGGEEGGRGDPVVQAEDPAVDADFVEVGESTDLVRKEGVGLPNRFT